MTDSSSIAATVQVHTHGPEAIDDRLAASRVADAGPWSRAPSHDLRWLLVLRDGLGHIPYLLEATDEGRTVGVLPLCFVRSTLFGRFLVSLPYLNSGGVQTADEVVTTALIDQAVSLADRLDVKHLELRHETERHHPALSQVRRTKVHMRLPLPPTTAELWQAFKSKLRSQVRKGEQHDFQVRWGAEELLPDFYVVFSRNMRDLGTPVFGRSLFASILRWFPGQAELCVVSLDRRPVAAALLMHGDGVTEVPSASSRRDCNSTNANMVLYWQLLQRAIERGSRVFDFGRSSPDSGTYRFKEQWGPHPEPAVWQYYVRRGQIDEMRPESKKYRLAIRIWQRLPLPLTRWLGPAIVRGIP